MKCPNCQTENSNIARFCTTCGRPLIHRCSNCRAQLPTGTRLCPACDQPAPRFGQPDVQFAGERRVTTIMFADISGFTTLVDRMGPEEVRTLINDCFDQLAPIIEKYGGVIDKFIGDEIMALFGAPVAHEDDPARALRAALEMMDGMSAFKTEQDVDLGMHIGINTGLVVAGEIGSQGHQQYSVIGSAVNLAARLRALSRRSEILVGPETYSLTAPLFRFEPLEPIQIKGRAEPLAVYRLQDLRAQPRPLRGLAGLKSPFVGRERELTLLRRLSQNVAAGKGQAALIVGEAGLGKSRLIAEWQALSPPTPAEPSPRWAAGHCLSYGQTLAYHLIIDLLRSLIDAPASTSEKSTSDALLSLTRELFGAESIDVFPYLAHLLSLPLEGAALERVTPLDPQTLQNRYLVSLRRLLRATAARQPLILILEDIHWADPSSTELLIKLLPLTAEAPLLICLVTRPDHDTPGWRLVEAARDRLEGNLVEISLPVLSEVDSQQLISNLLEIESLPDQIRSLILQKAEGNPFFVEEMIRMLIDREVIVPSGGRWIAQKEIDTSEIPDTLHGLLLARIDRLPDDVKHTLRVASVIGRQFSVRVLEEVLRSVRP